MDMPNEYFRYVSEMTDWVIKCLPDFTQPQTKLLRTKFLMDFSAIIREISSTHLDRLEFDNARVIENETSIELDYEPNSSFDMDLAISSALVELQIPKTAHKDLADTILRNVNDYAQSHDYATPKILHMELTMDMFFADDADDHGFTDDREFTDGGSDDDHEFTDGGFDGFADYEPRFVPASETAVQNLERTIAQDSSTECSICREKIIVGSEPIRIKYCSHIFHEDCIVKWLRISGVCPLCRFRMAVD